MAESSFELIFILRPIKTSDDVDGGKNFNFLRSMVAYVGQHNVVLTTYEDCGDIAMKSLIFFVTLFSIIGPVKCFAEESFQKGIWEGTSVTVEVKGKEILLNGEKFFIGKETIANTNSGKTDSLAGGPKFQCNAETRMATLTDKGEMILVRTYRSKPTGSTGISCKLSSSIESFSAPHTFEQIVLTPSTNETVNMKKILIAYGPQVSTDDLKNPKLSEENALVKGYIEYRLSNFRFDVQTSDVLYSKNAVGTAGGADQSGPCPMPLDPETEKIKHEFHEFGQAIKFFFMNHSK